MNARHESRDRSLQLFRPEALAEQRTPWLGVVLLQPRASDRFFVLLAALALIGIACLGVFGTYSRTASIKGWLVPEQGVVRVLAPRAGVVTGLYVTEGARVRQGDRLATIS